jgi:hypothetical protein
MGVETIIAPTGRRKRELVDAVIALEAGGGGGGVGITLTSADVDVTGVSEASTTINSALNSLPVYGGPVTLPAGEYRLVDTLNIGNGSSSAFSTRMGQRLVGAAQPGFGEWITGVRGAFKAPVRLTCSTNIGGPLVRVNGPLDGWGIKNIEIDAAGLSPIALETVAAQSGEIRNVHLRYATFMGLHCSVVQIGAVGYNNALNHYSNFHISLPWGGDNSIGMYLEGLASGGAGIADCTLELFDQMTIVCGPPVSGGANQQAMVLAGCDNVVFRSLYIANTEPRSGGQIYAVVFGYPNTVGADSKWPTDVTFDTVQFGDGGTGILANIGVPDASVVNRAFNISTANGVFADPGLAGLKWGYANVT